MGSLPSPPYTTVNNHDMPTAAHTNVQEEHKEQCILGPIGDTEGEMDIYTRLAGFDFVNISRKSLQTYCSQYMPGVNKKQNVKKLRSCVFNNMFTTLIEEASDEQVDSISQHYGVKLDKHLEKRRGRMKRYFQRNENQIQILQWMIQ